jgi:hypothetical protein
VLASDLTALSSYLGTNFKYDTGPFNELPDETPAKRFLLRSDYNINNSNKVSFRYNHLNSFSDTYISGSTSALTGRSAQSTAFLTFQNSTYQLLENIRSGIGEWNAVIGKSAANQFQSGYTTQDESRNAAATCSPGRRLRSRHVVHELGFEPFTFGNSSAITPSSFRTTSPSSRARTR